MQYASSTGTPPLRPLKWYKKLSTGKARLESNAFLIEGDRAIRQIIENHPNEIVEVVTKYELPSLYNSYPVRFISDTQFRSICLTENPQGPLAVVSMPPSIYSNRLPKNTGTKVLLLEDVQDPGNVGTLIRTAVAFGFSGIILSDKCADPLSPKCVQATAGTVLSLWLRRTSSYVELATGLREKGYHIVAADLNGEYDPSLLSRGRRFLLSLGNEASGLSREMLKLADDRFRIPIDRKKAESLNVAVSGAICMYLSTTGARRRAA